ncbi:MAG: hypothetical protein WAT39_03525 [Planctomycetota bacterium]
MREGADADAGDTGRHNFPRQRIGGRRLRMALRGERRDDPLHAVTAAHRVAPRVAVAVDDRAEGRGPAAA